MAARPIERSTQVTTRTTRSANKSRYAADPRYEALDVQSRQNRVTLASPRLLILRVGRSGNRHQQRKVGCSPRCFRGRPAVHFDVLVSAVVAVAVLRFELRRLGQSLGDGREGILPQSRIDVLLPDVLGDGSARGCRSTALERYLVRHEIRGGGRNQNPNEAVSPNIRKRLLESSAITDPRCSKAGQSAHRRTRDRTRHRVGAHVTQLGPQDPLSRKARRRLACPRGSGVTRGFSARDRGIIARITCICNNSHASRLPPSWAEPGALRCIEGGRHDAAPAPLLTETMRRWDRTG